MRALLYVALLVAIGPFTIAAPVQSAEPDVQVITGLSPDAVNVYGHWISEDGCVELRYLDGELYADGWRIFPLLGVRPFRGKKPGTTPKGILLDRVFARRAEMAARGESADSIVKTCREELAESGLVEKNAIGVHGDALPDGIELSAGSEYWVHWIERGRGIVRLGPPFDDHLTPEDYDRIRAENAHSVFLHLAEHLELGHMFLAEAIDLPTTKYVPRSQMEKIASYLRQFSESTDSGSPMQQTTGFVVSPAYAEQVRNPVPEKHRREF